MAVQLILYFIFILGGASLSLIWKRRFEEMLPLVFLGIIMVIFLSGTVGRLKFGVWISLAGIGCLTLYMIFSLIKDKERRRTALLCIFTPGFVMFTICFIILSFLDFNRVASFRDEFSHWASVVKVMTMNDSFGTLPEAKLHYAKYPPGMAVFQYFVEKIQSIFLPSEFNEWSMYFSYHIFSYSLLMPFLRNLNFKKISKNIPILYIIILAPSFFCGTFFWNLQVEHVLGVLFGAGLAAACFWPQLDTYCTVFVCLTCSVSVLIKDAGIFLSAIVAVCFLF